MRGAIPVVVLFVVLSGCIDSSDLVGDRGDPDPGGDGPAPAGGTHAGPVTLLEYYNGTVTGVNAAELALSPDQLGDVERWFYIHDDTTRVIFELEASDELSMYLMDAGCHGLDCAEVVDTENGKTRHEIDEPDAGAWEVVFFKQEPGAAEIDYTLTLTKNQTLMHPVEREPYHGEAVTINAGALVISPDQLGDVYREFWVHEGTSNMTVNVTTDEDLRFVLGQSDPSRDADSEETWITEDGRLELEFDDPQTGGWYYIIFAPEDPGVHQPDYKVEVTKRQGS